MPIFQRKASSITAYCFDEEFLHRVMEDLEGVKDDKLVGMIFHGAKMRARDGGGGNILFEVWNEMHETWIGVKVGDWIRTDLLPEDAYPIDADYMEKNYEQV